MDDIFRLRPNANRAQYCKGIPPRNVKSTTAPTVGHYGIFSGRKFRETIYPRIREVHRQTQRERIMTPKRPADCRITSNVSIADQPGDGQGARIR